MWVANSGQPQQIWNYNVPSGETTQVANLENSGSVVGERFGIRYACW